MNKPYVKNLNILIQSINKDPLLIGKGPTFDYIETINTYNYTTIGFNHVVEFIKCDIVSIIDIDVVKDCTDSIYNNTKSLIIPWYPHDKNNNYKPCNINILDYADKIDVISAMIKEGRLYVYNASSAKMYGLENNSVLPNYNVYINNGDTIFNILASNGFQKIFSIGLDGGVDYSNKYSKYTPCGNGRSFSESLNMIDKISRDTKSKLIKLI